MQATDLNEVGNWRSGLKVRLMLKHQVCDFKFDKDTVPLPVLSHSNKQSPDILVVQNIL